MQVRDGDGCWICQLENSDVTPVKVTEDCRSSVRSCSALLQRQYSHCTQVICMFYVKRNISAVILHVTLYYMWRCNIMCDVVIFDNHLCGHRLSSTAVYLTILSVLTFISWPTFVSYLSTVNILMSHNPLHWILTKRELFIALFIGQRWPQCKGLQMSQF